MIARAVLDQTKASHSNVKVDDDDDTGSVSVMEVNGPDKMQALWGDGLRGKMHA